MSISKLLGMFAMSAALLAGCGDQPPEATEATDQILQKDGIYTMPRPNDPNRHLSTAFNLPINGLHRVPRSTPGEYSFYAMSPSNATAYPVLGAYTNAPNYYPIVDMTADNSMLTTKYKYANNYYTYSGTGVNGTDLIISMPNGWAELRIDAISTTTNERATSYGLHKIRWKNAWASDVPANWQSICKNPTTGADEDVVLLGGWWWYENWSVPYQYSDKISFSCVSDTLAQCVNWGYAPWDSVPSNNWGQAPVALREYFRACTLVKRATYCPTQQYTVAGNMIQLYEAGLPTPIHQSLSLTDSSIEGRWTTAGVKCLGSDIRMNPAEHPQFAQARQCNDIEFPGALIPDCTAQDSGGWQTLLGSKYVH